MTYQRVLSSFKMCLLCQQLGHCAALPNFLTNHVLFERSYHLREVRRHLESNIKCQILLCDVVRSWRPSSEGVTREGMGAELVSVKARQAYRVDDKE